MFRQIIRNVFSSSTSSASKSRTSRQSSKKSPQSRNLRLERLETRELLSLTNPLDIYGPQIPSDSVEIENAAPLTPSDVTLDAYDATTRSVMLSWTDNSDAETGFRIEYSTDGGETWRLSQTVDADVASRVSWGVAPNKEYTFRVCALYGSQKSDWAYSETLATVPVVVAPSDLTLGEYNPNERSLTLSWIDESNAEIGYYLERSTDGGKTWRYATTVAANVTTLKTWNVQPEQTYIFRLCALNGNEKIGWAYSEPFNTKPAPTAPSSLTLGQYDVEKENVKMSWTDNSDDETGFRVEYSTDGGATWRLSEDMAADVTERIAGKVHKNSQYVFRVCAVRDGKASDWTYSEVLDTTQPLVAPSFLTLGEYDRETETLPMSWIDNSDDETGFRVEYSTDGGETWFLSETVGADVENRTAWGVHLGKTYVFRCCATRGTTSSEWTYSEALTPTKTDFATDFEDDSLI